MMFLFHFNVCCNVSDIDVPDVRGVVLELTLTPKYVNCFDVEYFLRKLDVVI